jgi:hypothetical protein
LHYPAAPYLRGAYTGGRQYVIVEQSSSSARIAPQLPGPLRQACTGLLVTANCASTRPGQGAPNIGVLPLSDIRIRARSRRSSRQISVKSVCPSDFLAPSPQSCCRAALAGRDRPGCVRAARH